MRYSKTTSVCQIYLIQGSGNAETNKWEQRGGLMSRCRLHRRSRPLTFCRIFNNSIKSAEICLWFPDPWILNRTHLTLVLWFTGGYLLDSGFYFCMLVSFGLRKQKNLQHLQASEQFGQCASVDAWYGSTDGGLSSHNLPRTFMCHLFPLVLHLRHIFLYKHTQLPYIQIRDPSSSTWKRWGLNRKLLHAEQVSQQGMLPFCCPSGLDCGTTMS